MHLVVVTLHKVHLDGCGFTQSTSLRLQQRGCTDLAVPLKQSSWAGGPILMAEVLCGATMLGACVGTLPGAHACRHHSGGSRHEFGSLQALLLK